MPLKVALNKQLLPYLKANSTYLKTNSAYLKSTSPVFSRNLRTMTSSMPQNFLKTKVPARNLMRGLLYYGNKDIRFSDQVEEPVIKVDDEVLIDIAYCGICGSDLSEYVKGPIFFPKSMEDSDPLSGEKLPQCLGHEMSGTIIKTGEGVKNFKVGDRVVVEAATGCADRRRYPHNSHSNDPMCAACKSGNHNTCNNVSFCGLGYSDGGLAEKFVTSESHLVKLPEEIPFDVGALIEPLAVAWHAVRISGFQKGDEALVLGAGPIGLAVILALQGFGASKIVVSEISSIRRKRALEFGAEVFNPADYPTVEEGVQEMIKDTKLQGFGYSYDASGVQATLDTSILALRAGGKATNIAIWADVYKNFKPMSVTMQEKTYLGSICYHLQDFQAVIDAIVSKRMDIEKCKKMITSVIPLEDGVEKGFEELVHNKDNNIKILLTPKK